MTNETLKPCPFCGSNEINEIQEMLIVNNQCNKCAARGPRDILLNPAQREWNTRTSQWISVENKLPENDRYVIIGSITRIRTHFGYYSHRLGQWKYYIEDDDNYLNLFNVTHWQELPIPPKETE